MPYPAIKYSETFYKNVSANTEDRSTGVTPANGEQLAIYRFRANGSDPSAYVALVWDRGPSEKIIASTRGDIDLILSTEIHTEHLIGDGVKKLQICLINDTDSSSPIIGGSFETIGVD